MSINQSGISTNASISQSTNQCFRAGLDDFATSRVCLSYHVNKKICSNKQANFQIFFRIVESLEERVNGLVTRASEESVSTKLTHSP